ncbi:MAG: hypothetical protein KAI09_04835 [Dehalococcoidales bacterium]|nr:hypothetical protein [Dehalococcoidales bacterium]
MLDFAWLSQARGQVYGPGPGEFAAGSSLDSLKLVWGLNKMDNWFLDIGTLADYVHCVVI